LTKQGFKANGPLPGTESDNTLTWVETRSGIMGEVIKLPRRKKSAGRAKREQVLASAIDDAHIRAALLALYENDKQLDRVSSQTFKKIFRRLETLEALVFAQSIIIAELRGTPLTLEQKDKIVDILRVNEGPG
jgi:hypothetical protein